MSDRRYPMAGVLLAVKSERQRLSPEGAFASLVASADGDGHQRWQGPWNPFTGIGKFHHRGSYWPAPWFALEQKLGRPLADGMRPLQRCRVRMCVARDHLYEGPVDDYRGDVPILKPPPYEPPAPHVCGPDQCGGEGDNRLLGAYQEQPMFNPRTQRWRRRRRWYAAIKIPGVPPQTVRLGTFATAQEAHAAWAEAHRGLWQAE